MVEPELKDQGLDYGDKSQWPAVPDAEEPMDILKPGSRHHEKALNYLNKRIEESEHKMNSFKKRWRTNELHYQAYIDLDDYEERLQNLMDEGKPAQAKSMNVPYAYSTIESITTYCLHTFTGRRPYFAVSSNKAETAASSMYVETVIQHQLDHNRFVKQLRNFLQDMAIYGVGVMRCIWEDEWKQRTVNVRVPGLNGEPENQKYTEWYRRYSGNVIETIDPFMFFPDPRVPMSEVNDKGEYVFWRSYAGRHELKEKEASGEYRYVDYAGSGGSHTLSGVDDSGRTARSGGEDLISRNPTGTYTDSYHQIDQGSVTIIPKELGLSERETPEKWLFTIANKRQIIQAEPLDYQHDMHPVAVTEPQTLGHTFGSLSYMDMIYPFQTTISWLINSHIHNVRASLNNMLVVNPKLVELQDLKEPEPGGIIRLKSAAQGMKIDDTAIKQLAVQDITRSHITDLETITRLADQVSGVNDNLRGIVNSGGRKTATEIRTSGEAAASRMASLAKTISAQAIVDLTEQMVINTQQFLDEDMYVRLVGEEGMDNPIQISPDMIEGDYHYPVHDGTLPWDRVALLDQWKELFGVVLQDPELRAQYDVSKMLDYMTKLGGLSNVDQFKKQTADPQQVEMMRQQAMSQGESPAQPQPQAQSVNAVEPNPRERILGQ